MQAFHFKIEDLQGSENATLDVLSCIWTFQMVDAASGKEYVFANDFDPHCVQQQYRHEERLIGVAMMHATLLTFFTTNAE